MRSGSKYDPLRDYLIRAREIELSLSLEEIEEVLGFGLCRSAETPQWWANIRGSTRHTQYRAWRDAGFEAFLSNGRDRVRFVRVGPDTSKAVAKPMSMPSATGR